MKGYVGLGAGSEEYIKKTGSMPDIAILDPENNEIICYIEVTGSNKGLRDDSIYVTLDKFNKYHSIAKNVPVYYVYLCISHGKLMWSGYISYEDLYPYAEIRKDIVTRNFYGVDEYFIRTPKSLWKPLRKLGRELLGYLGGL